LSSKLNISNQPFQGTSKQAPTESLTSTETLRPEVSNVLNSDNQLSSLPECSSKSQTASKTDLESSSNSASENTRNYKFLSHPPPPRKRFALQSTSYLVNKETLETTGSLNKSQQNETEQTKSTSQSTLGTKSEDSKGSNSSSFAPPHP
jgi:hypothetical protein